MNNPKIQSLPPSCPATASEGQKHATASKGRWDAPAPFKDDATAHFDRTDPGQSLSGDCRHDFFATGGGRFRCRWCPLVLPPAEP